MSKSGYLRIISEVGLVGLVLLIYAVWSQVRLLSSLSSRYTKLDYDIAKVLVAFIITALLCYLARGYTSAQFWLAFGLCITGNVLYRKSYQPSYK